MYDFSLVLIRFPANLEQSMNNKTMSKILVGMYIQLIFIYIYAKFTGIVEPRTLNDGSWRFSLQKTQKRCFRAEGILLLLVKLI